MICNLNIVFDTNTIKLVNDVNYARFEMSKTFTILHEFVKNNNIDNINIFIPQICIDELLVQYSEEYKIEKKEFEKTYNDLYLRAEKLNWNLNLIKLDDLNYKDYLDKITKLSYEYLEEYNLTQIIPNCNNECLPLIIKRSLDRIKPFFDGKCSKKPFSDAGFKDAIFIESIKQFFTENNDEIIIITSDKVISEINVYKEFEAKNVRIMKFDLGIELVNFLCDKLKIDDCSKQYSFCKDSYYIETLENDLRCKVVDSVIRIEKIEDEYTYYKVETIIEKNNLLKSIYVKLDEINNFDEAQIKETGEVIYTW